MKKIYNFTNIASHYRKSIWEKMFECNHFEFHLFHGKNDFLNIKEIDFNSVFFKKYFNQIHTIENFWFKKNILFWQKGVVGECFKSNFDIAVFLGEFQVLSTWIAMVICKLRGVKVVYWTHGLYGNESFLKKKLRVFFYKTADKLLLYENRGKNLLIKENIEKDKIDIIYNSLDYDNHLKLRKTTNINEIFLNYFKNNNPVLMFIGRLTKVKKIDLLFNAQKILKERGVLVNVVIVGDGEIKQELIDYVENNELKHYTWFYGSCYDEVKIAELIYNADLCVSPGNVGLTAIHSLSFGTPVCTHNNFCNQMPEVEVVKEGLTGCFFEEDNVETLVSAISDWLLTPRNRKEIRTECYNLIDKNYNPYYQLEVIKDIIKD